MNGEGCTCFARCEADCICEADWTPAEVISLRNNLNSARAEIERLRAENERLRNNIAAIEDEKNTYLDYVGDALGQAADGETLWDASQRVLSERDRLRAERDALRDVLARICDLWDHHCTAHGDGDPTPLHADVRAALRGEGE